LAPRAGEGDGCACGRRDSNCTTTYRNNTSAATKRPAAERANTARNPAAPMMYPPSIGPAKASANITVWNAAAYRARFSAGDRIITMFASARL
jgi:hypothetical protein